ncbi:MAG: indoleamine 2,3-dioxygenase, partial [Actinobacteria bacterium]|nr:indoleamine 2,3-dioxygenase [Actinomycetota bacterium]
RASYEADLGELRAFLPGRVPLDELPSAFEPCLSACAQLPLRYPADSGGVRRWLEGEFPRDDPAVRNAITGLGEAERDRLMTALAVLAHTYRWDCVPPAPARFHERQIPLPPGIAGPWTALARRCGQPRVGTTWSLHLCNWRMTDRPGGAAYRPEHLSADNVRIAHSWLSPPADVALERFSTSFVLLEARGAVVLRHLVDAVEALAGRRPEEALAPLEQLHSAVRAMTIAFSANVRRATVDPATWRHLVQPTFPWSAEADVPGRVEGGPSGSQLGTIQALDAALGVEGRSSVAEMAMAGRRYMPRPHRRFLQTLDGAGPLVRGVVRQSRCEELNNQFNNCIAALSSFRATHQARGAQYLRARQAGSGARASTGLTIGVDDDDPVATFEGAMAARRAETEAATVTGDLPPTPASAVALSLRAPLRPRGRGCR